MLETVIPQQADFNFGSALVAVMFGILLLIFITKGFCVELPNVTLNRNTRAVLYSKANVLNGPGSQRYTNLVTYYFSCSCCPWRRLGLDEVLEALVTGDRSTLYAGVTATAPAVQVVG